MPGNRPQWWSRCQRRQAAPRFDSMRVFFRQELLSPELFFCPDSGGRPITTTAKTGQVRSLEWTGNRLRVLDQRLLPTRVEYVELERWHDVVSAIQSMQVRGAPAIGVAGAYGVVLAARALCDFAVPAFREEACRGCRATRSGAPDGSEPPLGRRPHTPRR